MPAIINNIMHNPFCILYNFEYIFTILYKNDGG